MVAEARHVAHRVLCRRQGGRVQVGAADLRGLGPADRHQVNDLVLGVRRHLFLLDAILRRFLRTPVKSVPGPVRDALRLGVYELVIRDRAPSARIVGETVDLAGRSARLRGLVNAVLRAVADGFEAVPVPGPGTPRDRHTIWLPGDRAVRFHRPVLPDPAPGIAKYLGMLYTLTDDFVTGMMEVLPLEFELLFRACSARRPVALRPTARAGGADALVAALEASGVRVLRRIGPVLEVRSDLPVGEFPVIADGRAVVQDLVAASAVEHLQVQPGDRVLDLCAAPGGKTVQLAEQVGPGGEVVAADVAPARLERLRENVARLDLGQVRLHDLGPDGRDVPTGEFAAVLVDAPCSNTGVLMKRVDARFRVHATELSRLVDLQRELLSRGGDLVSRGGRLCYSTCSILPAENDLLVRAFLGDRPDFRLVSAHLRYPHRTRRDGGYAALLARS